MRLRPRRSRRRRRRPRRRRSPRRRLPEEAHSPGGREGAYDLALKALSHKERTQAELEGWLRERDVGEDALADAIERLIEAGAIDDASFALRYTEDKRELAGWGPERIRRALGARGIAPELIEATLGDEDEARQVDRAVELLSSREADVGSDRARARALSLLTRRGYSLEVAYEAVRGFERRAA